VFELTSVTPGHEIPQHSNSIAQTDMKINMVNKHFH